MKQSPTTVANQLHHQGLIMKVLGALLGLSLLVSAISGALEDELGPGGHVSEIGGASAQSYATRGGGFEEMEADFALSEPVMLSASDGPPPPAMHSARMKTSGRSAKSFAGGGGGGSGGGGGYDTLGQELLSQSEGGKFDPKSVETMLVRRGNMDIASDAAKLETIAGEAEALVAKAGGFTSDRNTNRDPVLWGKRKGEAQVTIFMTLKVPVAEFFPTVHAIKALVTKDEVLSSSDSVEDVTDQFVDVAARAATLDATRLQLVKLMEKANEVDQVLKIQRELSNVVQQLEVPPPTARRAIDHAMVLVPYIKLSAPYISPGPGQESSYGGAEAKIRDLDNQLEPTNQGR